MASQVGANGSPVGQPEGATPAVEPGARWAGLLLFAAAAALAVLAPLAIDGTLSVRSARETAPLAAVVGGLLGWLVITRWPRSFGAAAAMGGLTAFVAFVFFTALYLFGEAIITAFQGEQAGPAIAAATERLWDRLPTGALAALASFILAAIILRALGAAALAIGARRSRRARRR